MSPSWATPILKLGEFLFSAFRRRSPIRVSLSAAGLPLTFVVKISNDSERNVKIHQVRAHYGAQKYNCFFGLVPYEPISIEPRNFQEYHLPYGNNLMGRRFQAKRPPSWLHNPNAVPPWESQLQLFLAIANGSSSHSWVEVDFDLVDERRFCEGQVKAHFQMIEPTIRGSASSPKKNGFTFLLPTGFLLGFETLNLPLDGLIELARNALNDPEIVPGNFGALKHFFFVNVTTGSLLDGHLEMKNPLRTLCVSAGDVIEFRLCKPPAGPEGMVLNPMRGVTKFVK